MKEAEVGTVDDALMFLDRTSYFVLLRAWLCTPNEETLALLCDEAWAHIDFLVVDQDEEGEKNRRLFFRTLANRSVVAWSHLLALLIELRDMETFLCLKPHSSFEHELVVELERGASGLRVCGVQDYAQWFQETYGKHSRVNTLIVSSPRTA